MKKLLLFVFVIYFAATSGLLKTRFKRMKCTVLNKTVLSINFCYVRAYSRNYASLNWEENRNYPMGPPLIVTIRIQYRYGTILRDVLKAEFDLCSFGKGKTDNLIANTFWAVWEKSVPTLFQGCPFKKGIQRYMNISYDDISWPSVIPSGMYRAIVTIGTIWILEYDTDITSDIKTSY